MIVWHTHTHTVFLCIAFAFVPFRTKSLCVLLLLHIACTFCTHCCSFHILYYVQYVISFKQFSRQLWWSYSGCNRTASALYRDDPLNPKHLSETLRNKCYFISLFRLFNHHLFIYLFHCVCVLFLSLSSHWCHLCQCVCVCVCDAQTIVGIIFIFYCAVAPFVRNECRNKSKECGKWPKGSGEKKRNK